MKFHLYYKGPLKANGTIKDKHYIREVFHPQLAKLWEQEPLASHAGADSRHNYFIRNPISIQPSVIYTCKDHDFACLVNERLKLHAELDILFLRSESPGQLISSGGDIDNRLKTLFDGLRYPTNESEIPHNTDLTQYNPFHCLLSDDGLITKITVTTGQLLVPNPDNEVVLIITVQIKATELYCNNIDLVS